MDIPSKAYFDSSLRWVDHTPVLEVFGELDISSGSALRVSLTDALKRCLERNVTVLVVDFTRCSFMDSEGLKVLLEAHDQRFENGEVVRVVVPDFSNAARTFEVTSEYHGLAIYQNVTEAIRASGENSTSAQVRDK